MPAPQFHIGIKNNVTADAGDGVLELFFLDEIKDEQVFDWNSFSIETNSLVSQVVEQLNIYKPKKVRVSIDSWGGDADAGKGVYNVLKGYPCKVEVDIVNKAASAATVIACAGTKIRMPKTGMYVIHQASNAAVGTSKVLREAADVADLYTDTYCEIYSQNNRKGKSKDSMMALIADGDYWMTGKQAEEMGFVDECYNDESISVTANIETAKARYAGTIPASLQKIMADFSEATEPTTDNSILTKIETAMKSFSDMVTAAINGLKGTKITARVVEGTADVTVDVTAAITPVMAELAANMQTEVTAELTAMETRLTASLEEKYGATITALKAQNDELKTTTDSLTAELQARAGAESGTGGKAGASDDKRTLVGKFAE